MTSIRSAKLARHTRRVDLILMTFDTLANEKSMVISLT